MLGLVAPGMAGFLTVARAEITPNTTPLTTEEQALADKGAVMEMYRPSEHSGHYITTLSGVTDLKTGKMKSVTPESLLCYVFGLEDAQPARSEGTSMAAMNYTPQQAEQFLFAEGWDKYHDRFFTRALPTGSQSRRAAPTASKNTSNTNAAFGTLFSRKPNGLFFGRCSGNWTTEWLAISRYSTSYSRIRRPGRGNKRCSSNSARIGKVDEAVQAFKKNYLAVVHQMIEHLEAEEPANSSR
jgi:hypothetical protein